MAGAVQQIAVIGASSHAANVLADYVADAGVTLKLTGFVRDQSVQPSPNFANIVTVSDYQAIDAAQLQGLDAVLCLIGTPNAEDDALLKINAELPGALAKSARDAGVRQFIYLSSLAIFGHAETIDEHIKASPVNGYGRSKLAGEAGLAKLATADFAVAMLRIPILYDAVKTSKFTQLAKLMRKLGHIPVRRTDVARSVLHYRNLAIVLADMLLNREQGTFFAADPGHFMMRDFARMFDPPVRPLVLPDVVTRGVAALAPALYARLFESSVIADACLYVPQHARLSDASSGLQALVRQTVANMRKNL